MKLGMSELESTHLVSDSPEDTIMQWLNAGGMISFYDYPLDIYTDVSSIRCLESSFANKSDN